eukprot:7983976-Lingulodinium_polyedra.AAC.1
MLSDEPAEPNATGARLQVPTEQPCSSEPESECTTSASDTEQCAAPSRSGRWNSWAMNVPPRLYSFCASYQRRARPI